MEGMRSELTKIDMEVQTSLQNLDHISKEEVENELKTLREEKQILEGKIRGYLALSDICKEYKDDYKRLQAEYQKLLQKVNCQSQQSLTGNQFPYTSGSPASFHSHAQVSDPALNNRHETDQRTKSLQDSNNKYSSSSMNPNKTIASTHPTEDHQIRTQDLFDVCTDPLKSSEGTKQTPRSTNIVGPGLSQSGDSSGSSFEKYPMQESLVQTLDHTSLSRETSHSSSTHRFEMVSSENLRKRQTGRTAPDDDNEEKSLNEDINTVLQSVQCDSGPEGRLLITKLGEYIKNQEANGKKLKKMNDFLLIKNSELEKKCRNQETELCQIKAQMQYQALTAKSVTQSQPTSRTASESGWVEVQTTGSPQREASQQLGPGVQGPVPEDVKKLKSTNAQLREANQRWSQEWNKLQAHFENRISDLNAERDRLAKELMDWKLNDDANQREYEKMLTNAKKKAADEETAKEDALTQLSSANDRCEALQTQVSELKDTIATLRRNPSNLSSNASNQHALGGPGLSRSEIEMQTEIEVLRQQLVVFQEDFDRERTDRATAQSIKDDFKKQNESLKKRVRALEQKNSTTERQMKLTDDTNKRTLLLNDRLQTEINELKKQLQREQESRLYGPQVGHGPIQPPIIQSAGLHQQNGQMYGQQNMPMWQPNQQYQQPQQQPYQHMYGEPMMYNNNVPQQHRPQIPSPAAQQQPARYYNQAPAPKQPPQLTPSVWACNQCTYKNLPQRTVCEMCGYIRSPNQNFQFTTGNEPLRPRGDEFNPMYPHRTPSQNDLATDTVTPAV